VKTEFKVGDLVTRVSPAWGIGIVVSSPDRGHFDDCATVYWFSLQIKRIHASAVLIGLDWQEAHNEAQKR
jgi:hypothetical protein